MGGCRLFIPLLGLFSTAAAHALPQQVIQPDEPASKDAFVYQFLETTDMNELFFAVLPAVKTATNHTQQSYVRFDLSGISMPVSRVASAKVELYQIPSESTGFGASPTAAFPLNVSLYPATSDWPEALKWINRPTLGATALDTRTLDGSQIGSWVTYDLTNLTKAWLDQPATNFGFGILADQEVRNGSGDAVIAVFESSSGANKPRLTITYDAIPGDANLDNAVDVNDLSIVAQNWLATDAVEWTDGDFNGDLSINEVDLGLLALNWQASGGPGFSSAAQSLGLPTNAPEPGCVALIALATSSVCRRRRGGGSRR